MTYRSSLAYLLILCTLLVGCSEEKNDSGAYILRHDGETHFIAPSPLPQGAPTYPWDGRYSGLYPRITKDFFRCRGNPLNPIIKKERGSKEPIYFRDCRGAEGHGLLLIEGKEFIYPILIDLLNTIQEKTNHRVVITTGHRCPTHNAYCDSSPSNYGSKHMLGAEVDFYVEGMEDQPDKIIEIIKACFDDEFVPYNRPGLNVSTPPIYNKEIFIKHYLPHEGRDRDNTHPHPYLCIQVRHVSFDEPQTQNYLRY